MVCKGAWLQVLGAKEIVVFTDVEGGSGGTRVTLENRETEESRGTAPGCGNVPSPTTTNCSGSASQGEDKKPEVCGGGGVRVYGRLTPSLTPRQTPTSEAPPSL